MTTNSAPTERETIVAKIAASDALKPVGQRLINRIPGFEDVDTHAMKCLDCGVPLEHDVEAESWLRRPVLFDPDVVDIDVSGEICAETGDEHRIAS